MEPNAEFLGLAARCLAMRDDAMRLARAMDPWAVSHWQGGDATSPTNARIVEARRCLLVAVRLLSDADHQCAMAAVGIDPDPASGE